MGPLGTEIHVFKLENGLEATVVRLGNSRSGLLDIWEPGPKGRSLVTLDIKLTCNHDSRTDAEPTPQERHDRANWEQVAIAWLDGFIT